MRTRMSVALARRLNTSRDDAAAAREGKFASVCVFSYEIGRARKRFFKREKDEGEGEVFTVKEADGSVYVPGVWICAVFKF